MYKKLMYVISVAVLFCAVSSIQAAVLVITPDAPEPGAQDIASLVGSLSDANNVGTGENPPYTNDATTYIAHDRGGQGQTFITGDSEADISGVWVRHVVYTAEVDQTWYRMQAGSQLQIRITDPAASGTDAFVLASETYDVTGEEENALPADTTNDQTGTGLWFHVILDTPVALAANTEYGFDLTSVSGLDGAMFFETMGIRDDAEGGNPYADGSAYVTGAAGVADNILTPAPGDRVFVVELESAAPVYPVSLGAAEDITLDNGPRYGQDGSGNGSGLEARDIADRRHVIMISYDISELKSRGPISNVSLSNFSHDQHGEVNVYGIIEDLDLLEVESLTWNTAPGVQNDPAPELNTTVTTALDVNDLTDVLLTFSGPGETGVRFSTDTSDALADFINSDTDGIITLLVVPSEEGSQLIIRSREHSAGGSLLEGEVTTPPPPAEIPVENASFELPGTEKIKGWNGEGVGGTPAEDIPGWSSDTEVADSGVETGWNATDGEWTAFLMGGDPSVWQLTSFVIGDADVIELKVDAANNWQATTLQMSLYIDDNGARITVASVDVELAGEMQEFSMVLNAADAPAAVGGQLGIEFNNVTEASDSWLGLDNVRLSVQ